MPVADGGSGVAEMTFAVDVLVLDGTVLEDGRGVEEVRTLEAVAVGVLVPDVLVANVLEDGCDVEEVRPLEVVAIGVLVSDVLVETVLEDCCDVV